MSNDDDEKAAYYDADESHRDPVGEAHELPPEIVAQIEEARKHPERLVRRRRPDA